MSANNPSGSDQLLVWIRSQTTPKNSDHAPTIGSRRSSLESYGSTEDGLSDYFDSEQFTSRHLGIGLDEVVLTNESLHPSVRTLEVCRRNSALLLLFVTVAVILFGMVSSIEPSTNLANIYEGLVAGTHRRS